MTSEVLYILTVRRDHPVQPRLFGRTIVPFSPPFAAVAPSQRKATRSRSDFRQLRPFSHAGRARWRPSAFHAEGGSDPDTGDDKGISLLFEEIARSDTFDE